MIYTKLTKKALEIAFNVHKNQKDNGDMPYVYHPFYLALQMPDENSICVALLHDIMEDSENTYADLLELGFKKEVVEALKLLTNIDKDYMVYIEKVRTSKLATIVKIADLKHNSDLTRLNQVTETDLKRIEKYKKALDILTAY